MNVKHQAMTCIEAMPDDISGETLLYELEFKLRVTEGIESADRGELTSHEEAMDELSLWLKSLGQQPHSDTSERLSSTSATTRPRRRRSS